jgi:trehalose 6-phosphate phosphatase
MDTRTQAPDSPPQRLPGGVAAHAFFLDIDGTLLEIADAPDRAIVDAPLLAMLRRLDQACGGALALVTGRPVQGADEMFAPLRLPSAGQHGAERRDAKGTLHVHAPEATQMQLLRQCVGSWASGNEGLLIEDKGMSLAVHYRRVPEMEALVHRFLEACLARTDGEFRLQPGRMVLEVKPAGRDKGTAITEFMGEAPFAGRIPIFLGDDATDETGFDVVNPMGGITIKVGPGPTLARWRLDGVTAVRRWLAAILDAGHS